VRGGISGGSWPAEDFAQQEDRPLDRCQTFEEEEQRHRERLVDPENAERIILRFGDQRLGEPLANGLLAPHARRLEVVDAQSADDRDQKRLWRTDLVVRGLLPADEGLLKHVLGVG
jgi:hypothetical protein